MLSAPFVLQFSADGAFKAWDECCTWLKENGYSYSATCAMSPVAVLYGDYSIAKWRNLTRKEIAALDGSVTGNFRDGPLVLRLKRSPEQQRIQSAKTI